MPPLPEYIASYDKIISHYLQNSSTSWEVYCAAVSHNIFGYENELKHKEKHQTEQCKASQPGIVY